jgi:hypothetical protein
MENIRKISLDKIIFQTKFEEGFLYWDRCGKIWKRIIKKWKGLSTIRIDTSSALFQLDGHNLTLGFDSTNINTTQNEADDPKLFAEFTNDCISIISEELEIDSFTRIGNRFQFLYPVGGTDDFYNINEKLGIVKYPQNFLDAWGSKPELVSYKINFSDESGDMINSFSTGFVDRKLLYEMPKSVVVDDSKVIKKAVLFDIDRYTNRSFESSLLDSNLLITDNYKLITEKLLAILGEVLK